MSIDSPVSLGAVDVGIPRRLSARRDDRFFDQGLVARFSDRVAVFLNDRELAEVTSWDVDKGEVIQPLRVASGAWATDSCGNPAFGRLSGKVEVRWLKGMGPPEGGAA